MSPTFPMNDLTDGGLRQAILQPNGALKYASGRVERTNAPYIIFGEPRHAVGHTPRVSTFGDHVRLIIGRRSDEQVSRIAASPIVASVAHAKARWNFADVKAIAQTMGFVFAFAFSNLAVAIRVKSCNPWPAFVWPLFANLVPKSLGERYTRYSHWRSFRRLLVRVGGLLVAGRRSAILA